MANTTGHQVQSYVENNVLTDGEEIAWQGRPDPMEAAKVGWLNALFGVLFLAFAVFWVVGASDSGWFALFGLPFVAVGLFMISRPARQYLNAGKTYYAVTNKRVLLLSAGKTFKVTSITPSEMTDYEREDKVDGTGSIRLRKTISHDREGPSSSVEPTDGLWGVADVKGASEAIARLRAAT